MLPDVFMFILDCISQVFGVLKKFVLMGNFNYFDFLIYLNVIVVLLGLLRSIKSMFDEEQRWLSNMKRYDEYRAYQNKLKSYEKEKNG